MSGKTKVVLKARDGRTFDKEFETYEEACAWIAAESKKHGIEYDLEHADFSQEQTIEIYREKKEPPCNQ